jgi:phage host-nuclease inhibitor protein Gam
VRRWSGSALIAVGLFGMFAMPSSVTAEPDRQAQLRKLTKEAAALSKAYRGEIASLDDTRKAAERAEARVKKLKADLVTAEQKVAQFAQTTYMGGGIDSVQIFSMQSDLSSVATLAYLNDSKTERLNNVTRLIAEQKKAAKSADQRVDQLKKDIKELQGKQREVEKLLAKFGFQAPDAGTGLTARMVSIRNLIMQNFPMPFGVGCFRAGDFGEHGKGRACDFMISTGGRMPDASAKARGDALAEWCVANGRRLGIMYIIWQQKYYDIRTGAAPKMMANRGSNTANHYDHVHVSVL